jgi:hypothetical protein
MDWNHNDQLDPALPAIGLDLRALLGNEPRLQW